jgi:hypothetical protein
MGSVARDLVSLAFVVVPAATACQAREQPSRQQKPDSQMQQPPTELVRLVNSGLDVAERAVIRDFAAWQAFWRRATRHMVPAPRPPLVDFQKDMVIIAGSGPQRSGGYSVHIDSVYEENGLLVVVVREVSPGPNCMNTMSVTSPAIAVRVPQRVANPSFLERKATRDCP